MIDTLNQLADMVSAVEKKLDGIDTDLTEEFTAIHASIKQIDARGVANAEMLGALTELFQTFLTEVTPLLDKAKKLEKMSSPLGMMRRGARTDS